MARPKKNNADYFSHDADMRNDPKIRAVRKKFGLEGYAVWCMLLETLTHADGFELDWDELSIELIAPDFDLESEQLNEMVDYFVKLKLVRIEGEILVCDKLIERFESLLAKRNRRRKPQSEGISDGQKPVMDGQNPPNDSVSDPQNPQSKVKESKGNKNKLKDSKIEEPPISPKGDEFPKKETQKQKDLKKSMGFLENAFTKTFNGNIPSIDHEVYGNLWALVIEHQELKQTMNAKNVFKAQRGATSYISSLIKYAQGDIQRAEKVVIQSIENQWIKLVELKEDKTYGKESNEDYRERMYAFADERTRQNLNAIMANQGDGNGAGETSAQAGSKTDWESLID